MDVTQIVVFGFVNMALCFAEWKTRHSFHYYFSTEETNQSLARSTCREKGADLVSIESQEEQDFIKQNMKPNGYWIGLTTNQACDSCKPSSTSNECKECRNRWFWVDGARYAYRNWENKKPAKLEECVRLINGGIWRTAPCEINRKYICKTKDVCVETQNICNNGSCQIWYTEEKYKCTCKQGFSGQNCNTNINECLSNPCQNEGSCEDQINRYICRCPSTWEGPSCEIDVNECLDQSNCVHGTCYNAIGGYNCTCADGFMGEKCDVTNRTDTGNGDEQTSQGLLVTFYVCLSCMCVTGSVCLIMTLNDIMQT